MGIKNFYKWIKTNYGNCIKSVDTTSYDHVYIDLNYLLHICYYNCDNLNMIIKKLESIILNICTKTRPMRSLNLYGDGTSPFAKLCLQRERRFNSNDDLSLNFTPGTKFITSIPHKLKKILEIIKKKFKITINIDTFEPGEAEIKIKYKILENYIQNNNETHILATNDADVILIVTSHESYKKCNILLNDCVLSISELITSHTTKYGLSLFPYLDFSFLNLFMGNDYLPKLNLITVEKLWLCYSNNLDIYKDKDKYLIKLENKDIIINKQLLIDILNSLISNVSICRLKTMDNIYDDTIYENYFNGLIWNLHMYRNGDCTDYYYICNSKKPINIINLLIYVYSHKITEKLIYNHINKPVPSELCSILLLPPSGVYLIDEKFTLFIENIKYDINIHDNKYKINKNDLDLILHKFNNFLNLK